MPNPRNRLKFTGDTHLPDVGDDGGGDEDTLRFEPAEDSGREEPGSAMLSAADLPARGASWLDSAREQVRQRPVAALAGAFVLGWVLARV